MNNDSNLLLPLIKFMLIQVHITTTIYCITQLVSLTFNDICQEQDLLSLAADLLHDVGVAGCLLLSADRGVEVSVDEPQEVARQ